MTEDQLFEWETKPKRGPRSTSRDTELVPRPPGYHLITNTKGMQGFHRSEIPTANMAANRSVMTLCGIVGRRVGDVFPDRIPLCESCEQAHRNK